MRVDAAVSSPARRRQVDVMAVSAGQALLLRSTVAMAAVLVVVRSELGRDGPGSRRDERYGARSCLLDGRGRWPTSGWRRGGGRRGR